MESFTPVSATLGGGLIGLAAGLLWVVNGRIAGISGIFGGVLPRARPDWAWRALFLIGLPVGAVAGILLGSGLILDAADEFPAIRASEATVAVAGLLVGIGSALARGCTSGHGVCGLARLSRRSIIAVGVFMTTAALTVFIERHVL
ncbi:YeeE/YedE family protein [Prosthecomicrobium pneumaticum]|uniref:Putative membrane protein YedE/YeeE n=1 Tax=Prosthecomicrobium pneumaticum TaxID=81895 RepID=A0A7W9FKQ8_9HYPH|nr:YeeE/YedE thiosulfate transporter family protein [Prosthecomicrobium pneumaticum]MBB5751124.1 putative membrane protein YedE/YeeE [Prosthecomicrobium pneumaticum]